MFNAEQEKWIFFVSRGKLGVWNCPFEKQNGERTGKNSFIELTVRSSIRSVKKNASEKTKLNAIFSLKIIDWNVLWVILFPFSRIFEKNDSFHSFKGGTCYMWSFVCDFVYMKSIICLFDETYPAICNSGLFLCKSVICKLILVISILAI